MLGINRSFKGRLLALGTLPVLIQSVAAFNLTNPQWCTDGAAVKFAQYAPAPGVNWTGDAGTWLNNAGAAGWATTTSRNGVGVGAIMVWTGQLGHVAVITGISSTGFTVTEMNMGAIDPVKGYPYTVNFAKFTTRTFTYKGPFDRYRTDGTVSLSFAGFILPRRVDLNQQAFTDTQARAAVDSRFRGVISGSFGVDVNWDPNWELCWATFNFAWFRTVTIYHATSKSDARVRYTMFYDPDRRAWTDWIQAR